MGVSWCFATAVMMSIAPATYCCLCLGCRCRVSRQCQCLFCVINAVLGDRGERENSIIGENAHHKGHGRRHADLNLSIT